LNVTLPVGLLPPVTVAVSVSDAPRAPPADAAVATVGVAWAITTVSFAAPHAPVTALLAASPEYEARQRYVPGTVGVYAPEGPYAPLPFTAIGADVNTRLPALQTAVALGPYRRNRYYGRTGDESTRRLVRGCRPFVV
jgi:hypothetical protein